MYTMKALAVTVCLVLLSTVDCKATKKSTFNLANASTTQLTDHSTETTTVGESTKTTTETVQSISRAKIVFVIAFITATILIILLVILIAFNTKTAKIQRREKPNDIRPSTR
ncbi:unnamed protein product [Bursaphelenchus okinawaensis]|uniref:Uncharacterized protein n=1 Tax=Bursaphelenchus okinawaensis TaxID=465554 RepID=A0A811K9N7_9BILA|nr:unnamed protein product [Bursaphelenchus okinawaensis]CAG9094114.1 unnamed protein product [Bursaphelenchus okinawaensis]